MPELTVVVCGTRTGIGKTWLSAALITGLRTRGMSVVARKPVQSFDPSDVLTDADILAGASGEPTEVVCPWHRRYELPLSPPMACEKLGRPRYAIGELVSEMNLPTHGVAVIEGVGGPRSPLAFDGDTVDLADALHANLVVLVADPGVGVINEARLSVPAFGGRRPVVVYLNRFSHKNEVHEDNLHWLRDHEGLEVITDLDDWYQDSSAETSARAFP
jgi:dethiobiotin synthetase